MPHESPTHHNCFFERNLLLLKKVSSSWRKILLFVLNRKANWWIPSARVTVPQVVCIVNTAEGGEHEPHQAHVCINICDHTLLLTKKPLHTVKGKVLIIQYRPTRSILDGKSRAFANRGCKTMESHKCKAKTDRYCLKQCYTINIQTSCGMCCNQS